MMGKDTLLIAAIAVIAGVALAFAGMSLFSMPNNMTGQHSTDSHSHEGGHDHSHMGGTASLAPELQHAVDEVGDVLKDLPCYCGCNHDSIWQCYEEGMLSGCGVCKQEAIMAHELYEQGMDKEDIIAAISDRFA
jgi:hypothetical protein